MPNVDWNQVLAETRETPRTVNPRRRLAVCFVLFMLVAIAILARAAWFEVTEGSKRRNLASQPLKNRHVLPARRGTIVDRNGVVLAEDQATSALAVHYRYLENPPNQRWLRSIVRSGLTKAERKNPHQVETEKKQVRKEQLATREKLAKLCGINMTEWNRRTDRIQHNVERISRSVNMRQMAKFRERQQKKAQNPPSRLEQFIWPEVEQRPEPIIVREELDYHVIVDEIPPEVVKQIESQPEQFPGMKIIQRTKRVYPLGRTAAHLLGYMGVGEGNQAEKERQVARGQASPLTTPKQAHQHASKPTRVGKAGFERLFNESLQGHPGEQLEMTDRSGRVLSIKTTREVQHGQTIRLTIDTRLQQAAEALLDQAILRRSYTGAKPEHVGGAAVVMDIQTGEILAAASSPRFDPNWFIPNIKDQSAKINEAMTGPSKRMFNRVTQMAIPPGSVFKIITAIAALESGAIEPTTIYRCRGFMETEDAYRCQIYRRYKEGHGPIQLTDALAQSCNTYFFNIADTLGAEPILAWAVRLGMGQKTRVELPGESLGELPPLIQTKKFLEDPHNRPIDPRFVAIGQERLRTTPLQIARMLAVVAGNGQLLSPHLVASDVTSPAHATKIPQLHPETLTAIRQGLEATVTSPQGTAYNLSLSKKQREESLEQNKESEASNELTIAGKTGTAQVGSDRSDHAWFAAYAPKETPRYVVVVALEHAGNSSESAVPVARRIFIKMQQLGLFPSHKPYRLVTPFPLVR